VNELNSNEEKENGNRTEPNTQRTGETLDTYVTVKRTSGFKESVPSSG